jgi:hypothetical protein
VIGTDRVSASSNVYKLMRAGKVPDIPIEVPMEQTKRDALFSLVWLTRRARQADSSETGPPLL